MGIFDSIAGQVAGALSNTQGTSEGSNLPISMAQIQSALGHGPLQALAEKTGVSADQMASTLSEHLPGLVDQLTPHGKLPEGDLMSQGLGLLQGFMNAKG